MSAQIARGRLLGHLQATELAEPSYPCPAFWYASNFFSKVQTLKDLDLNGDAEIDFKEFMTMCRE